MRKAKWKTALLGISAIITGSAIYAYDYPWNCGAHDGMRCLHHGQAYPFGAYKLHPMNKNLHVSTQEFSHIVVTKWHRVPGTWQFADAEHYHDLAAYTHDQIPPRVHMPGVSFIQTNP